MADKVLTWSLQTYPGGTAMMLPSHYLDVDCAVRAVRIHTGTASPDIDALFDIQDDGVTIFGDNLYTYESYITNTLQYTGNHDIFLAKGETSDDMADNFDSEEVVINAGSWVTCLMKAGSAKDITVQLELDEIGEVEEGDG